MTVGTIGVILLAKQKAIISSVLPLLKKVSGSGFPVYVDKGATLERALINFMLDQANLIGFNLLPF